GQLLGFADAVGVRPEATIMVGDSRHDLVAGQAAGMIPVGVLTGVADEAELDGLAEAVLPDIGHLAGWIAGRR
ncbi:MAG: HAD hydrolase-like protein, partial [Pseudomonadota bacterium]